MDKQLHKVKKELKKSEKEVGHIEKLDKKRDKDVEMGKKCKMKMKGKK